MWPFNRWKSNRRLLKEINFKLDQIMTKQEQFDAALAKIDTATSDIADDLRRLKEEIANGNVSQDSLDRLTANADTLDALGKTTPEPEA
jgi:multidrug resistance efflux pump